MLETIKFIEGVVRSKNVVNRMDHVHIKNNKIQASDGIITVNAPIDLDLEVSPIASGFIRALKSCKGKAAFNITNGGRLCIKHGKLKSFLDCTPDPIPHTFPEGEVVDFPEGLFDYMKLFKNLIKGEVTNGFALGVQIKGNFLYITNGAYLIQAWIKDHVPHCLNIPRTTILEMLRIGEQPRKIRVTENNVVFDYGDGKWLQTSKVAEQWPEVESMFGDATGHDFETSLKKNIQQVCKVSSQKGIIQFVDNKKVLFVTDEGSTSIECGFRSKLEIADSRYNSEYFNELLDGAVKINLCDQYRSYFFGKGWRAILMGLKG